MTNRSWMGAYLRCALILCAAVLLEPAGLLEPEIAWAAGGCGNGNCNGGETCSSCPADCGVCPPVCPNGTCEAGESCSTCASDCGACPSVCGNSSCESDEDCSVCAADCGACSSCGDSTCDATEDCASCPGDCGGCATCPDAVCDATETCVTCAADCGACVCGDSICSASEDCTGCPADCGACSSCGDGTCAATESCGTCMADCGACASCGDGTCAASEDCSSCVADCGACVTCGNGTCEALESCTACPADCGACPSSGDFATCPYDLPACTADENDCCYRSFAAGSLIIPMDRCHQAVDTSGGGVRSIPSVAEAFCADAEGGGDDGMFQAYGLAYRLMQNKIPVYWMVNPTKDPPALKESENKNSQTYNDRDIDFWVLSSGATAPSLAGSLSACGAGCTPPVLHLDDSLVAESGSYTKQQFPTRGAAFMIAAEDRAEFDAFWHKTGTYAAFAGNSYYDFTDIEIYEVQAGAELVYHDYRAAGPAYPEFNGGDSGPVAVTIDYDAPRLARQSPANVSTLWLGKANLDEPAAYPACLTGAFSPSTAVYCDVTTTDISNGYLSAGEFDWAWIDNINNTCNSSSAADQVVIDEFIDFLTAVPGIKDGNSIYFMESSVEFAETCSGKELLGAAGGLDTSNGTPNENFIIRYPANLFAQFGDLPAAFASGSVGKWGYSSNGYQSLTTLVRLVSEDTSGGTNTTCSYHKSTPTCDVYSGTSGDMDDVAAYARFGDDSANGVVFYMGGRNISQNPNMAHLRMVLNSFLALPTGLVRASPATETITEIARSTPIVATVDGVSAQYQGTVAVITPARVVTSYAGGADDASFQFPHFTGHMRAIDVSSIGTTDTAFDSLPEIFDAADGIPPVSTGGCTTHFTAGCRTVWTNTTDGDNTSPGNRPNQVFVNTANVALLKPLLDASLSDADAQTLISRILAGRDDDGDGNYEPALGGVDRSTVAVIGISPFTGNMRPTMVYFGGLDGMVHAVCADAIAPCSAKGQELWAYIPRTQLPFLKSNIQRVDGSMRVTDALMDLDGTGVRQYRTIMTFQTGSGDFSAPNREPAVIAIDITDPAAPFLLWEVTAGTNVCTDDAECASGTCTGGYCERQAFELGVGLNTAMSQVKVGNELVNMTVAQSNNGGTGGPGFVVKGIHTDTGKEIWTYQHAFLDPRDTNCVEVPCPHNSVPSTGYPMGVSLYDSGNTGVSSNVLVSSLYGDMFLIDADTGENTHGTDPLFRFTGDYNPIGVTPTIFRSKTTSKLLAVIVSGGYADPTAVTWSPDVIEQFAVGIPLDTPTSDVPLDETTAEFAINLGAGNRGFAQAAVAGNELFIITDSEDVNSASFGLTGGTGTLLRYNLSDTTSPVLVDSTLAGGAGSVDVTGDGTVFVGSGKSAKKIDISADFDATGGAMYIGPAQGSTRRIWLRVR